MSGAAAPVMVRCRGHNRIECKSRPPAMSHKVTLHPAERSFDVADDEPILAAAIRQGIGMPYGCRDGACGSCKCKLVEGRVIHGAHQHRALSLEEEERGYILTCCATPQTDCVVEARMVPGAGEYPVLKLPARVLGLARAAPDVAIVRLQLPANQNLKFRAGQYIDFILRDGWTIGVDYQLSHSFAQESGFALRLKITKDLDARGLPKLLAGVSESSSRPGNWQLDAGYQYDDNVTRAKAGPDVIGDDSYVANLTRISVVNLGEQSRLVWSGTLGGEKFRRINGLSKLVASVEGEYQYRDSADFDAITYGLMGRLSAEQFESDMRDGFRLVAGVNLRQSWTDRINAFGALTYNRRFARSDVFNTREVSVRGNLDYALGANKTLYLGAEMRWGDIVSTGRPSLENISIAKVFAQDDAYAGGQMVSYRLDGTTWLTTVGYNMGLGPRDSMDFSWRHVQATPSLRPSFVTSPKSYIANQWAASYLMRF